ncbi:uncharacterized protein PRCAT00001777001 [Priceomyces carsonii]|uniref:uncharacterized protein n=1 Tax=Priceomyces carsonii TaxID=28549 RepID=UPI002ED7BEBC|nr:unnamed protein product [Priceomyces carsonii]
MSSSFNSKISTLNDTHPTLRQYYVEPLTKRFTICIAKIDLIIDDAPYSNIDDLADKYEEVEELLVQFLTLSREIDDGETDTLGLLAVKLSKILKVLVLQSYLIRYLLNFDVMYEFMKTSTILDSLVRLLCFSYGILPFNPKRIKIEDETTSLLILNFTKLQTKCSNIMNRRNGQLHIQDTFKVSKVKRLKNCQKGTLMGITALEKRSVPVPNSSPDSHEHFNGVTKCLFAIISKCVVSVSILKLYETDVYTNCPISFYLESLHVLLLNYKQQSSPKGEHKLILKSILSRALKESDSDSLENYKPVIRLYHEILDADTALEEESSFFKKTVLKLTENQPKVIEYNNYKYYIEKQVKEPEWVNVFFGELKGIQNRIDDHKLIRFQGENTETVTLVLAHDFDTTDLQQPKRRDAKTVLKSFITFKSSKLPKKSCKKCRFFPWHNRFHKDSAFN